MPITNAELKCVFKKTLETLFCQEHRNLMSLGRCPPVNKPLWPFLILGMTVFSPQADQSSETHPFVSYIQVTILIYNFLKPIW